MVWDILQEIVLRWIKIAHYHALNVTELAILPLIALTLEATCVLSVTNLDTMARTALRYHRKFFLPKSLA